MDLQNGLPKGFVLAKPITQEGYDLAEIYKLERVGKLIITRKHDGWKMIALAHSSGEVKLYTDGINEIDSRVDHIRAEICKLKLPAGTVLVGEAVVVLEGKDALTKVISIFHSSTAKAIQLQDKNGKVKFMVFGVIFPDTEAPPSYEAVRRFLLLLPLSKFVIPVSSLYCSFDEARYVVSESKWEGLVLYDKGYVLTYRTDGKNPKRPAGCYKWKPIMEDDFVVRTFIARPGLKEVKELILTQFDSVTGEERECGKLGSLSATERKRLYYKRLYPLVVQVKFEARFPSGKLRNARLMRIRDDKKISDCIPP